MAGILYFDGRCGMCTRSRNLLEKLNRTGELHTEPLQRPGLAARLGVGEDELMRSIWWLDASGEILSGAAAANAALAAAVGVRLPIVVYRLPGMARLQEAIYRWVAEHRYRFPGTTPHCENHPGAC